MNVLNRFWLEGVFSFWGRPGDRWSFIKVKGSSGALVEGGLGTSRVFGRVEVVAPGVEVKRASGLFHVKIVPLPPMNARIYSKTWETFEEVFEDVRSFYFNPKDTRIREMFHGIQDVRYVERTQSFERYAAYLKLLMEARAAGLVAKLASFEETVLVRPEELHEKGVKLVSPPDKPSSGRFGALRFDGDGWLSLEVRKVGNDPQEFVVEKTVELANVHEVFNHL